MNDVSEYLIFVVLKICLKTLICNDHLVQKGNECLHRELICLYSNVNAKYGDSAVNGLKMERKSKPVCSQI